MDMFGVKVDSIRFREAVEWVTRVIDKKRDFPFFIVTPNPEQVVLAQEDEEFKAVLNKADLAVADGTGLVIAGRLLKLDSLKERVSGEELMGKLIDLAASRGWKVMLVGGKGDTALKAVERLKVNNGELRIIGVEGIKDVRNISEGQNKDLIGQINEFSPDLLFVGFGAPYQEKWVYNNRRKIKAKVAMVVGGAIDQIVDPTLKPPRFIDRIGLGWLYRLLRQPWRWKRQLKLLKFAWMVLSLRGRGVQ